jgi:hypothetical protein
VDEVLEQFDELAAANDHFEFYWFPYGRQALVKRNNRLTGHDAALGTPGSAGAAGLAPVLGVRGDGERRFGALCRLGRARRGSSPH